MKKIVILLMNFLILSCSQGNMIDETSKVCDLEQHNIFKDDYNITSDNYIFLESSEGAFAYNIDKIIEINGLLYILDKKQKSVLLFDCTGKFIKK
jgi:hypothetical protein